MQGRRSEFLSGARDTLPMLVGAIPFGILFGAFAISAGLSVGATLGFSLLVFAGSSQFIAATLISQGSNIGVIVLTTFVVNLRHALYAASLGPYLQKLTLRWILLLAHGLTDETYAIVIQRFERHDESPHRHWYYLGSAVAMYANWQVCTVIGILTGQRLASLGDWGLEFALVVTFIAIVIPMLITRAMLICAVVAGVTAILVYDLPNQSGVLLASILGIAAGFCAETVSSNRESTE